MDQIILSKSSFSSKLPLLGIKKNVVHKNLHNNIDSAYLSEDVLSNIKVFNDDYCHSNGSKISNLWTNSLRRKRYKHLSDNPICVCGAGDDLQFLHTNVGTNLLTSDVITVSDKERRRGKKQEDRSIIKVPEKLVPTEFDLVFHHGSSSIQLLDGNHGTRPLSHKEHRIALPVMHPNNPSESRKIYRGLLELFEKSGLNDIFDSHLPTSLHRLLLFVKKEQDLYNIIFHELIKETTVDCIDRGELLANIRQRYRNIFVSVPQKIKDFHDTVIAQRILDRRLTEELTRFQLIVSGLSCELNGVKSHEDGINQMCLDTKDKLKQAVEETKTNADLLREYHGLYELQRNRLEKSSSQIDKERDCWRDAAYQITERVLHHYTMLPGIALVNMERQWISLSRYFVEMLVKSDIQLLNLAKSKATQWYNDAQKFSQTLRMRDDNVRSILDKEIEKIICLKEDFEDDYLTKDGQLTAPLGIEQTQKIFICISAWEKTISYLSELFGGQSMSVEEEKLVSLKKLNSEYTDLAVEVFNRHRHELDGTLYEEHTSLLELNKTIEKMMNQLYDQLTGDNGAADGITTVQTYLENWISRLSNSLSDPYFRPFPDSEWIRFKLIIEDWVVLLLESKNAIGTVKSAINQPEIKKRLEFGDIIQSVEHWSHRSCSAIESEHLKLHETIVNLQRNMVRWTSQVVIRLAPDFPTNSPEAKRTARIASSGIKELQENADLLHENVNKNTNYILNCCKDIVVKLVQHKIDTQSQFPDEDNIKFLNLKESAKEWISYSKEVLRQMIDVEYSSQISVQDTKNDTQAVNDKELSQDMTANDGDRLSSEEDFNVANLIEGLLEESLFNFEGLDDEKPIEYIGAAPIVQGVGTDSNVHSQSLVQDPDLPYSGNKFKNCDGVDKGQELPATGEAFTLIQISKFLQTRLRIFNNEAIEAENAYTNTDLEVAKSKLYLTSLEERCKKMEQEIEDLKTEKSLALPVPALLSSTNTLEHQMSQSTEKSGTPKSVTSSRHRAPRHNKKKK